MAKLVKCKDCGSSISAKATSCPHCGRPRKSKPATSVSSGCGCLVVLLAIVFFVVIFNRPDDFSPTVAQTPRSDAVPDPLTDEQKADLAATKAEGRKRVAEAMAKLQKANLETFKKVLEAVQANSLISSIQVSDMTATLTVQNLWHIRHKQIRLQDAQVLWQTWANIASPADHDKARLKLVDQNGNEVGGSRVWGGSIIWVQD